MKGANQQDLRPDTQDDTLRRSGARDLSDFSDPSARAADTAQQWPPNPRRDILEPQVGGRNAAQPTDFWLHMGPEPERIDRQWQARIFGHGAIQKDGGFAADKSGEYMQVGHVPASHPVKPVMPPPSNATFDSAQIPSTQIGAPLP